MFEEHEKRLWKLGEGLSDLETLVLMLANSGTSHQAEMAQKYMRDKLEKMKKRSGL